MRMIELSSHSVTNAYHAWGERLAKDPTVAALSRFGVDLADRGADEHDLATAAVYTMWPHRGQAWPTKFDPAHSPFAAMALGARLLYLGASNTFRDYTCAAVTSYPNWSMLRLLAAAATLDAYDQALPDLKGLSVLGPAYLELGLMGLDRLAHRRHIAMAQHELAKAFATTQPDQAEAWYYLARAHQGHGRLEDALDYAERATDAIAADPDMTEQERLWAERTYGDLRQRLLMEQQIEARLSATSR